VARSVSGLFQAATNTLSPSVLKTVQAGAAAVARGVSSLFQTATITPAQRAAAGAAAQAVGSSVARLFQQVVISPAQRLSLQNSAQTMVNSVESLFRQSVIPPAVLKSLRDGAQTMVNSIARLFTPLSLSQAVSGGALAAIPGRAGGGSLPEGLSAVGESGMEFAFKRGPLVDIIPTTRLPGFQLGTDFGAALLQHPQFTVPTQAVTDLHRTDVHAPGITIGRVEINNPKPEVAGDSIYRTLQKINYFAGRG
jgi:hypothetical protein